MPEESVDEPTTYTAAVGKVADDADVPADDDPAEDPSPAPRRRTSWLLITGRVVTALVSVVVLAAMSMVWLRVDELDSSKNTTDALTEAQSQSGKSAPTDDDAPTTSSSSATTAAPTCRAARCRRSC